MFLPEKLIADTNILFSFFKKDSKRRKIIDALLAKGVKLISPYFSFEELMNNKERIKVFSKISEGNFISLYRILYKNISTFSTDSYISFVPEATKLSPHKKDASLFALSLLLNNSPIWSDEIAFKKQSKIKIFFTEELLQLIKI